MNEMCHASRCQCGVIWSVVNEDCPEWVIAAELARAAQNGWSTQYVRRDSIPKEEWFRKCTCSEYKLVEPIQLKLEVFFDG